jgi:hypothetical protein
MKGSCISTCDGTSPQPSMMEVLVTMEGLICFTWFSTESVCRYLESRVCEWWLRDR